MFQLVASATMCAAANLTAVGLVPEEERVRGWLSRVEKNAVTGRQHHVGRASSFREFSSAVTSRDGWSPYWLQRAATCFI